MSEPKGYLLDVLRADQYTPDHIQVISHRADMFHQYKHWELARAKEGLLEKYSPAQLLEASYKKLGSLAMYFWFDEPSTRTLGSFDAARALLGIEQLGHTNAAANSSMAKEETFEDSMRTINEHLKFFGGGAVVMRTKKPLQPEIAAEILDFPVINAGDGQNEHPTQALQDVYTIRRLLDNPDKLNIVFGGDPRYSRTVHSLAQLLPKAVKELEIVFVGDRELWLDKETKAALKAKDIKYRHTRDMNALTKADIVYWTRFQKERLVGTPKESEMDEIAERYARDFTITEEVAQSMQPHARILHPLPRGPEIPDSLDANIHSAYWEQVGNAIPVRTALLEFVLRNLWLERTVGSQNGNSH
jgi:aspartate carbamoyltransferase catalytic subunit